MIIKKSVDKLQEPHCLVMFNVDKEGRCTSELTESEFSDEVNMYYEQRAIEFKRLYQKLLDNEISPIGFFVVYQHMDLRDVASRVRLRMGEVKRHLTPEGFTDIKVEVLKRYARVFNISVADFFQFVDIDEKVRIKMSNYNDRLLQIVSVDRFDSSEKGIDQ